MNIKTNNLTNVMVTLSEEDLRNFAMEVARQTAAELSGKTEDKGNWLTPRQVADKMKVTLSTLWRWEKEGYIKASRFGRRVRYAAEEVERVAAAEGKGGVAI